MSSAATRTKVQPAAFLRTTLPLGISQLETLDSGRYHSIWLPDHMVSFWPDSIWTPEFTDLATQSPSPHRHLDAMAVAGAAAVLTQERADRHQRRRHGAPSPGDARAVRAHHRSPLARALHPRPRQRREGEHVPYGFDFSKPVSRFEEALKVIRLLWESDGPVDFEGQFFQLHHARLDTEPFEGRFPPIWIGANGPRMLEHHRPLRRRLVADGLLTPEDYAAKLKRHPRAAERAGRDPMAIVPANIIICLLGDDDEIAEMLASAAGQGLCCCSSRPRACASTGYEHPMGDDWRGIQDIDPRVLTREKILAMLEKVDVEVDPDHRSAWHAQAGGARRQGLLRRRTARPKLLDYGGMAGLKFGARSPQKVRETEDEADAADRNGTA